MEHVSNRKNVLANLGLTVISVGICLLLVELYLSRQYEAERRELRAQIKKMDLCTTSTDIQGLIYILTPNKCGNNSSGFRDFEYSFHKAENTYRIVVIGDSVAYGHGQYMNWSFPKLLEQKFSQLSNDHAGKVQVISLARGGYTTTQELIILQREAFRYEPDLILWSYVLNDPGHTVYAHENKRARYHYKPRFHLELLFMKSLYRIRENMMKSRCGEEYHELLHCVYWEGVVSNLGKVSQLTAENNTPVLFLIHPIFGSGFDYSSYPLTSLHNQLADLALDLDFKVLDLTSAYTSYHPLELTRKHDGNKVDPWHPNKKGNELVADYLFEAIMAQESFSDWKAVIR